MDLDVDGVLDPKTVLKLNYAELSARLVDILGFEPTVERINAINAHWLRLVRSGSVPPTCYKIWLPMILKCAPHLLSTALHDPVSRHVRAVAIQQIARFSRSRAWKTLIWNVLGNAEGIRDAVRGLSIRETTSLIHAISQSIHRPDNDLSAHIDRLVVLLVQERSRSLGHLLDPLLPLCSSTLLENALTSMPEARVTAKLLNRVAVRHVVLLRRIATGNLAVPSYVRQTVTESCVRAMVCSSAPYTPVHHSDPVPVLPGVSFALDLFCMMAKDTPEMPKLDWLNSYIDESLRHMCRQKVPFGQIYLFLGNTLPLIALGSEADLTELLVKELLRCWSIAGFRTAALTTSPTKKLPDPAHPSRPSVDDKQRLEILVIDVIQRCPLKLPHVGDGPSPFKTIEKVLKEIAPEARLPFLKLMCRHSEALQYDMDLSPSEKEKSAIPIWPHEIMNLLPAADIKQLFDRMLLIHDCTEYIPALEGVNSPLPWHAQCQLKARVEADMNTEDHDRPIARTAISEMQKRAEHAKQPDVRSFWANQVVETTLASGSMTLYKSVQEWSTGFIGDNAVFPELIESYLLSPKASELLGMAHAPHTANLRELDALQAQTLEADEILNCLLSSIAEAWAHPLDRARLVVEIVPFLERVLVNRKKTVCQYQRRGLAQQAELIAVLLYPLIEVLVRYDQQGNNLEWWESDTLLTELHFDHFHAPPFASFLDRLIQEIDEAFRSDGAGETNVNRRRIGFPNGLPVHRLVPSNLVPVVAELPDAFQYTAAKVSAVLFGRMDALMTPVTGLNDRTGRRAHDEETDDLGRLLFSYIFSSSRKQRDQLLLLVWDYYTNILAPHPEHLEIFKLWLGRKAREWGLRRVGYIIEPLSMPKPPHQDPSLGREPVNWDPREAVERRGALSVRLTVLHCRMMGKIPSRSFVMRPAERKLSHGSIWSVDCIDQLCQKRSVRECDVVVFSAMLFIASLTGKPLLRDAFPSPEAMRWPLVVLEREFVQSASESAQNAVGLAIQALENGISLVPTHLLHRLVILLLDDLPPATSSSHALFLQCIVGLTKLFPSTDQPELGVEAVLRIMEHFPDESAYRRHLRLSDLGKALKPDDAVIFVQSLANLVREKLDSPTQFGKIMTVKMVAQLVAAADFVPTGNSLSILQSIYHSSSYFDLQTEVISSMLSLLERDPVQPRNLYSFVRRLALTAVGPKRQDQELAWNQAEQEGNLPDVSGFCSQRKLELFTVTAFHKLPPGHRRGYVEKILVPMVDKSIAQHNRWMKRFLHHFELSEELGIDFGPFAPNIIDFVLNIWHDYLPASFLLYSRSCSLQYTLNPAFETINAQIISSPKISSPEYAPALEHWTEVLHFHRLANPFFHLNALLSRDLQPSLPAGTGITEETILLEYKYRMGIVARNPEKYDLGTGQRNVSSSTLIDGITSLRKYRDMEPARYERYSILMQEIVTDIETLRGDQDTTLSAQLPSSLLLRTKLLPTPYANPQVTDPVTAFADIVLDLIGRCTDAVTLFESHRIDDMMGSVGPDMIMPVAWTLGHGLDITSTDVQACLTARVVAKLLSKATRTDIRADEHVEEMLKEWKVSQNEYVRRIAWEIDG